MLLGKLLRGSAEVIDFTIMFVLTILTRFIEKLCFVFLHSFYVFLYRSIFIYNFHCVEYNAVFKCYQYYFEILNKHSCYK